MEHDAAHHDAGHSVTLFKWSKPFATFVATSLPAFGAALTGIRAQGEFRSFAKQSERTCRSLKVARSELINDGDNPSFARTVRLFKDANRAMMSDLRVWG